MHGCTSRLRPFLKGEGKSKKSKSWKTTSFGRSITGNQHCDGRCNRLCSAASFVQNQRLSYTLVDLLVKLPTGCLKFPPKHSFYASSTGKQLPLGSACFHFVFTAQLRQGRRFRDVSGRKTNVKKVCARRRLDGSRCFRFGLRIYNFFGLFPTAKI